MLEFIRKSLLGLVNGLTQKFDYTPARDTIEINEKFHNSILFHSNHSLIGNYCFISCFTYNLLFYLLCYMWFNYKKILKIDGEYAPVLYCTTIRTVMSELGLYVRVFCLKLTTVSSQRRIYVC